MGCGMGSCELIVLDDMMTKALEERCKLIGKVDYPLQKSVLDYLKIDLTPVGLVVEEFIAGSSVTCSYQYEVISPTLVIEKVEHSPCYISVPTSIDTSWLRTGLALSLSGFSLMMLALYVYIVKKFS